MQSGREEAGARLNIWCWEQAAIELAGAMNMAVTAAVAEEDADGMEE